jgi:hypothetical protein
MADTPKDFRTLEMECSDGSVWAIPVHIIIDNRSRYYAERDKDTTYEAEYEFASNNPGEITEWAVGEMNWEDVAEHAQKIRDGELDMQDEWMSAEKHVRGAR